MKKKTRKRNSWVITLPLIAIAGGYLYFFFLPTKVATAKLRKELEGKRTFTEQSRNLRVSVEDTKAQLSQVLSYTKTWRDSTPSHATLSGLFGDINQQAKDAGVVITNFHPQQATLNETFSRVPISIELSGSTNDIFGFLRAVEQLESVVWIDTLNIEATGKHGHSTKAEVNLVAFTANSEKSD